ncbi:MAG TPA: hypothetical protein PKA33_06915 [Amaricoccus sp.]|uniref:hypothetical protein n=1 Tax=Amaricoccus sp. TaxID=1872485 RepID=UPI002B96A4AE|nr:hypothetical protein [Amaricoccus sp.]HMQ91661.1 hypothetical protein [Amaricoccus sp.]HMR52236.1 hypothetical protein [Amaricoccus sp.]HMT99088.1 hypothetical protein [Amaricoccus sp.]
MRADVAPFEVRPTRSGFTTLEGRMRAAVPHFLTELDRSISPTSAAAPRDKEAGKNRGSILVKEKPDVDC